MSSSSQIGKPVSGFPSWLISLLTRPVATQINPANLALSKAAKHITVPASSKAKSDSAIRCSLPNVAILNRCDEHSSTTIVLGRSTRTNRSIESEKIRQIFAIAKRRTILYGFQYRPAIVFTLVASLSIGTTSTRNPWLVTKKRQRWRRMRRKPKPQSHPDTTSAYANSMRFTSCHADERRHDHLSCQPFSRHQPSPALLLDWPQPS